MPWWRTGSFSSLQCGLVVTRPSWKTDSQSDGTGDLLVTNLRHSERGSPSLNLDYGLWCRPMTEVDSHWLRIVAVSASAIPTYSRISPPTTTKQQEQLTTPYNLIVP